MDKIRPSDIDFSTLSKSKNQGTKSIMYNDKDNCIKIFNESCLSNEDKKILYKKILEMDGIKIENVLLPKILIVENDMLIGYIMDNFKDSTNLLDYFSHSKYENCKDMFESLKKASLILRDIHKHDIICQDLSFDNVLIDNNLNIKFCDIDGCCYKGYVSPYISVLLKRYLMDYRKEDINISKNNDRLSFALSFFFLVYLEEIQKVSKRKYSNLSKHLVTLENCKDLANMLVDRKNPIECVPYIDELICDTDNGYIDRDNQIGLKRKILSRFFL